MYLKLGLKNKVLHIKELVGASVQCECEGLSDGAQWFLQPWKVLSLVFKVNGRNSAFVSLDYLPVM